MTPELVLARLRVLNAQARRVSVPEDSLLGQVRSNEGETSVVESEPDGESLRQEQ